MNATTVRSLAKLLPYSRTTISDALRGSPRVNPETARRIREAAVKAGYRVNPLTSALMSEVRRSRQAKFRGALGIVLLDEPARPPESNRFFTEQVRGIRRRADELGFSADVFVVGRAGLTLGRLDSILQSRGIRGVVLLPAWNNPDYSGLHWERYSGVYADYLIQRPPLHSVCPNHFGSMTLAMQKLHERGYRRPGLVLRMQADNRLQHVWAGGYLAFLNTHPDMSPVPPLVDHTIDRERFGPWFRRHQPDVVIGHIYDLVAWMGELGCQVPETHGFLSLNLVQPPFAAAGLDQQPALIGERAAEIVIAQIERNEVGIPRQPSLTTITAGFVDGPTLRPFAAAAIPLGFSASIRAAPLPAVATPAYSPSRVGAA